MKLNWGTNIAIVYILFVIISVSMTVYMMNMDVELVTDDYYEKELDYQERINSINRTNALAEKVEFMQQENSVSLKFPKLFPYNEIKGEVHLYRPSDEKLDVLQEIELDSTYTMKIDTEKLMRGYWKIKVDWRVKSVKYFNEFKLFL